MRKYILAIRDKFHPLFYARKLALGRYVVGLFDRPIWIRIPEVHFKVRGRMITHGLAFGAAGSQERNPAALALACVRQLEIRSFWDVGANIGYYSWLLISAAPHLEVKLFEPLPANADLIRATLKRHTFPNARLVEAAASDQSGKGALRTDSEAGATSSLELDLETFEERHFGVRAGSLPISLVTIDNERKTHGPVDFIKIDVEGHEGSVLRGAQQTTTSDQPILFVECGHPGHACLTHLTNQGYRLVDADQLSLECNSHTLNYFGFPERFASLIETILENARQYAQA